MTADPTTIGHARAAAAGLVWLAASLHTGESHHGDAAKCPAERCRRAAAARDAAVLVRDRLAGTADDLLTLMGA